MNRVLFTALGLGIGLAAITAQPAEAAQPPKGLTNCAICHDLSSAKKKLVGPPLAGIFGRKPSITGVPFAKWDQASLDKWLTDPAKVKPGTSMTFKVPNAADRKAAVDALKTLK